MTSIAEYLGGNWPQANPEIFREQAVADLEFDPFAGMPSAAPPNFNTRLRHVTGEQQGGIIGQLSVATEALRTLNRERQELEELTAAANVDATQRVNQINATLLELLIEISQTPPIDTGFNQ
ncbi:MAG: hypothetical protein M3Q36_00335 [bacterium]|nr:hypothetical protein [bacterium]